MTLFLALLVVPSDGSHAAQGRVGATARVISPAPALAQAAPAEAIARGLLRVSTPPAGSGLAAQIEWIAN